MSYVLKYAWNLKSTVFDTIYKCTIRYHKKIQAIILEINDLSNNSTNPLITRRLNRDRRRLDHILCYLIHNCIEGMQLVIVSQIIIIALVSLRWGCYVSNSSLSHPSFFYFKTNLFKENETPFDMGLENVHKFLSLCKRTVKEV